MIAALIERKAAGQATIEPSGGGQPAGDAVLNRHFVCSDRAWE